MPNIALCHKAAKLTELSQPRATTETALMTRGVSQLYLSLGDPNPDGSLAVRLYYKPLVLRIWFGAVVMVIGGAAVAWPLAARAQQSTLPVVALIGAGSPVRKSCKAALNLAAGVDVWT